MLAFFVQEQINHRRVRHHTELARIELPRLAQNLAQHIVGYRARRFDNAFAFAAGARLTQHVCQRLTRALARHLQQAQR